MLMRRQDTTYWEDLTTTVGENWNRFWFTPASSKPLALVRITTALLVVIHLLSYWSDLARWFAANGMLPPATITRLMGENTTANYHYSLLNLATTTTELRLFEIVGVVAGVLLAAGVLSQISAAVCLVILLSFVHRAPMITGVSEPVLGMLLFYLCLAPSGQWFGFDGWLTQRKSKEEPEPSVMANIAIRLIQVHLAAFVLMMGLSKLSSEPWWTGDAVWYLIAQTGSRPVDLTSMRNTAFLVNAWTHAIVFFELLFPVLVWNRFARPILLVVGAVLWLLLALVSGHLILALSLIAATLVFWSMDRQESMSPARV